MSLKRSGKDCSPLKTKVRALLPSGVCARPRFALAVLYVWGRRDMADRFLTVVLLSVLLDYSALCNRIQ
jgi:hypothetical protein